jgi:Leucine-rich repeat (LRR) protein
MDYGIKQEIIGTLLSPHTKSPFTVGNMSPFRSFFFFLLFPLLIKSDETKILLNLKASLQKSNPNLFALWDPEANSACNFTGVTCTGGLVSEIDLSNQNLAGEIPWDSICELKGLERLSLGFNYLYGHVSEDLKNCLQLHYLDLGNNGFTGVFPDISALSNLRHLYINTSAFSGSFPWKSLQNMTEIETLSIGDNLFDPIEFPREIFDLHKLIWLQLSNCSLQGKIPPEIGNLNQLINLELSVNNLSGSIPDEITKLINLWQLELYGNQLSGKLPVGLRNLTKLTNFDVSMNNLEGDISEVRFLTNVVSLQLFENGFSGEVPVELGQFKKLVNLSLYTNNLTGFLPRELGSWANFDFIDVSENSLTGPIPPDMCKQGTMRGLLMLQNKFTGGIPQSYADCKTLKRLRVSNNSLSGVVPAGIWGLPNVDIIDVALNQFDGLVTSDIKNAKALSSLLAGNNNLSGDLPMEISQATSLVKIDLSYNHISGNLPDNIGDLKSLSNLKLQDNDLSGSIPESLGSCVSLTYVNMARNSLSGKIPSTLGSLPTLNSLNLSDNQISGRIPESLSSLKLSLLDLSHNDLSGRIPNSLSIDAYNSSLAGNPRLCSSTISSFQRCSSDSGMSKDVQALLICFASGMIVLLLSLSCYLYWKNREKDQDRSLKEESWDIKSFHVLTFTEDEILDSIKPTNVIGKGGSGSVYRVVLSDGKELAVKHIWNIDCIGHKKSWSSTPMLSKRGGKSKEFDAEVETLSSIRHVNVVKLYCSITSEDSSLLVYEYLPNGSLWDKLHNSVKMELDWKTRYEIALGSAKGLEYLHHGCEKPVIHRDVKSSNILLDEFLKPRIADFGLAKITNTSKDTATHVIAGTHGYIAPEYGYTYKVNEKSDVYSFGVVLMELITGKKAIEAEFGENKDIVSWVSRKLKSRETVLSIIDSRIGEGFTEDAIKVLRIAILCTSRHPTLRPTMRSVVQMLEDADPCKLVEIVITKDGNVKKQDDKI